MGVLVMRRTIVPIREIAREPADGIALRPHPARSSPLPLWRLPMVAKNTICLCSESESSPIRPPNV